MRNALYTKAVIKETFRMNPISVGIGRILQTDVILSGYRVPRGVILYFAYIKLNILLYFAYIKLNILFKKKYI